MLVLCRILLGSTSHYLIEVIHILYQDENLNDSRNRYITVEVFCPCHGSCHHPNVVQSSHTIPMFFRLHAADSNAPRAAPPISPRIVPTSRSPKLVLIEWHPKLIRMLQSCEMRWREMKIDVMASQSGETKTMTTWRRRRVMGKVMTNEAAGKPLGSKSLIGFSTLLYFLLILLSYFYWSLGFLSINIPHCIYRTRRDCWERRDHTW